MHPCPIALSCPKIRIFMKISVVILNWNRPHDTIKAVQSVLKQDYPDFEALVWDNNSSDDSKTVLEQAFGGTARVTLTWGDDNYGVAEGRNRAFRAAQGDILLSLDSDAWFQDSTALSLIAETFSGKNKLGAVSFEVIRPDGHLMWPFSRPSSTWRSQSFETIRVDGCAFAATRTVFEQYGRFPSHYSPYGAEDQHFAFYLVGQGLEVRYVPEVTVVHAFDPKGRNDLQFAMHVRNSLWIPMELFPFPETAVSTLRKAWWLWADAKEQNRRKQFLQGVYEAFSGFRPAHRKALSRSGWKRLRTLMQEDHMLARGEAHD